MVIDLNEFKNLFSDPSFNKFDPDNESDEDELNVSSISTANNSSNNDQPWSTSTFVTKPESSQTRRPPPSFREHRQKSTSSINLNVSSTPSRPLHRSLPPVTLATTTTTSASNDSFTNRFFSLFNVGTHHGPVSADECDDCCSTPPSNRLQQQQQLPAAALTSCLELTQPYLTRTAASDTNFNKRFFGRQYEPDGDYCDGASTKYLQKSKSTFCLNNKTSIDDDIVTTSTTTTTTCMNTNNRRQSTTTALSPQPLSVDAMMNSPRLRKTGATPFWLGDSPVSGRGEVPWFSTPRVATASRFTLSLPTTSESVSSVANKFFLKGFI